MTATGYLTQDDPAGDVAMGYTRGEDGDQPLHENVFTRPARGSAAGGGYSSLDDMLRLDQALTANQLCAPGWTQWVIGGPAPTGAFKKPSSTCSSTRRRPLRSMSAAGTWSSPAASLPTRACAPGRNSSARRAAGT